MKQVALYCVLETDASVIHVNSGYFINIFFFYPKPPYVIYQCLYLPSQL